MQAKSLTLGRVQKSAKEAAHDPPSVDGGTRAQSSRQLQLGSDYEPMPSSPEPVTSKPSASEHGQAYLDRLAAAKQVTLDEYLTGNTDYVDVLMEKPDEPAMVQDVAITDVIAANHIVRRLLCCGALLHWIYVMSVPFIFDISCERGVPTKMHLGFLAVAVVNMSFQMWCASLTKYGYLTLAHAPQRFFFNIGLSCLGLFDSYSDVAFAAMLHRCDHWLWKYSAAVFIIGVLIMQAVPGVVFLACSYNIPACLKLNEMNLLLMLLKPSVN